MQNCRIQTLCTMLTSAASMLCMCVGASQAANRQGDKESRQPPGNSQQPPEDKYPQVGCWDLDNESLP